MRILLALLWLPLTSIAAQPESIARLPLRENWAIQSSAHARETGEVISSTAYKPKGWYPASVPSTVFNALVKTKVYPDPYFGMNLRSVLGVSYPVGENFSNVPMPPDSPFRSSWWYRTEFKLPAEYAGKTAWLHFDAINYRANVWLNGRQVAVSDKMAGAWRLFEYDVTRMARAGQPNVLAVEVFPAQPTDLAITFVDWNPQPPDKNMGLWRDVYVTASGPVAIRFPHVITHLNLPSADRAELTVTAELKNASDGAESGILKGRIGNIEFQKPVCVAANETAVVKLLPGEFGQLKIANPRLWWPAQVGPQNLYTVDLQFEIAGKVSDRQSIRFGIREVTSELDAAKHRLFRINGKNILIRGAGYTFDMLLRSSPQKQEAELKYVRDMNLNTVRLEGKLEDDHFLDLCDEYGILVLAGWCCCDHWEHWKNWKAEDYAISEASLRDQIRRLRRHPSVFNWLNGSDNPPPPEVERKYIDILNACDWPNPYQSSATEKTSNVTGATGLKMPGPYEYIAPSYWLLDQTRGGAQGFNSETGPGPAVPPVESLRQMLPANHLWPIDSQWDFHTGGGVFGNLKVFTEALNQRYGAAGSLDDYARKAQVMAYEGHRAMFEAFGRNKYKSTGVIQWMLNNAWPSMIWHLYDYYLRPGGSYFGAKKACEPLHVQYSYDDASVVVVNSYYKSFPRMKVTAEVYDLAMTRKYNRQAVVDIGPDSASRAFVIPELQGLSTTYFVRLALEDAGGREISSNFYWLSTKPDVLDWDKSTWYHTPTKSFSDLRGLATLPMVEVNVAAASAVKGPDAVTRVTVGNPSRNLAFFVRLRVLKGKGAAEETEILPVLWQDNYFPLLPGEKREVTAAYRASDLSGSQASVEVSGWNVTRKRL